MSAESDIKYEIEKLKTRLEQIKADQKTAVMKSIPKEIWTELKMKGLVYEAMWPKYDEKLIADEQIKIAVQINGKVRGELLISNSETEENIKNRAMALPEVKKWLGDKAPSKVIYVKGRLVSIVG